jgi:hypothetical protein
MPKKYMLEVGQTGGRALRASFESTEAFGAISAGDRMVLIGDGGRLESFKVVEVEHTVWMEKRAPAHKVRVYIE